MNLDAKMNRRLLVLGALVLAIGVILVFRLWTLQIIQHDQFQERADNNLRRIATTTAIRGRIFDREGRELVINRPTMAVMAPALRIDDYEAFQNLSVDTDSEHDNARNQRLIDWVNLLADTLDMSQRDVVTNLTTTREGPLELRLLAIDVSMETVSYITEHSSKFEGVEIEARAVREYPHGSVAAHVLGYTGNISDAELALEAFADYVPSDIVGKTGVERSFEHVLQGVRGTRVLEVNAQGRLQHIVEETEPAAGQDIYLTIDLYIQQATESALRNALRAAHREGYTGANAGSAVVMKVETGEVIALASYPTFEPEEFIGGISQELWDELTDEDAHNPLNNRAISSAYPPASTFKSFVAIAAMDRLDWEPNRTQVCAGVWTGFGELWPWHCWRRHGHGPMNLYHAMAYSCNVVFYSAGASFHARGFDGEEEGEGVAGVELQEVVRSFGYGQRTGIDLPGESRGRVPDPEWKHEWNRDFPELRNWVGGDTVNLSIGQGDVLATPLQVAYSHIPIANGGTALRPQILHSVRDSRGELVHQVEPELSEIQPDASEEALAALQESLRLVITRGTGLSAFGGFQVPVAGKTGTAEVGRVINRETGERDQDGHSWFVGYAPAHDPQYVVAVMIENAGGGGAIAAPATRQIFAEIFDIEEEWVRARDDSR